MNDDGLPAAQESLPRSLVLTYLTPITTATRVRLISFWALVALGFISIIFLVCLTAHIGSQVDELAKSGVWFRWPGPGRAPGPGLSDYLGALKIELSIEPYFVLAEAIVLAPAILLPLLAAPVRRGRRVPSLIAQFTVAPLMVPIALATAVFSGWGIVQGYATGGEDQQLWWVLVAVPGILTLLLVNDICRLLRWIARYPESEGPAISFVSGRRAGISRV